ncbi:MAG: SurA N-terminal domain-containing protein [Thermoanaerobaculia bacterium]
MKIRTLLIVPLALMASAATCPAGELVERIVARVNDRLITQSEFDRRVTAAQNAPNAPSDRTQLRKDTLEDMIRERLIDERAKELGPTVSASDAEVDEAVERVKRQYNLATDQEFDAALGSSNMTRDDLKRQMRETITLQKVIGRDVTGKMDVSDDMLRSEYERQKEKIYRVPPQARVYEIVIRFAASDPAARERAVARMEEVRGRLASGGKFEDLAKEYSEGNAKNRGGDLGMVSQGELLPALDAAVFSSETPSEFPAPVLLPASIHLFRVTDRKTAGYKPFAEVSEDLKKRIGENLYDKRFSEFIQHLRREAFIKIYDPVLAKAEEKKG